LTGTPHVRLTGVSKRFGGAQALRAVDLDIVGGSIHGLVGENGAGKSTLGKIITGVHQADAGRVEVEGRPVDYTSPRAALDDGLSLIAQELSLVPQLTVIENVLLGLEPRRLGMLDGAGLRARYAERLEGMEFDVPMDVRVGTLRTADQQKVEIMRAIARRARLIVMDEPTASLTSEESRRLFATMHRLRAQGTTIVFVSHALESVLELCDTVTVLRDGRLVRTAPAREESVLTLVTAMIGRALDTSFPAKRPPPSDAPVVFEAEGLCAGDLVRDVSFSVRAGEIVGMAGLIGSGRSEVARAIFGADRMSAGTLRLDGEDLRVRSPRDAVRRGLALLPESRKDQGLVMVSPIGHNVSLPHLARFHRGGFVRQGAEERATQAICERVDVRGAGLGTAVGNLSGGNQQKVLFAKWLVRRPRLLIADEPTRGVDVGAKRSIYELLVSLAADDGLAVIVISSELEEVLGLAHRVLVMREGRVAGELDSASADQEHVLRLAFGTQKQVLEGAV